MKTLGQAIQPRFPLGQCLATPGALEAFSKEAMGDELLISEMMQGYLQRHQSGDWGLVCAEDAQENELSLREGFRIMSVYKLPDETKIWIITEADRSATTILLPAEY